MKPPMNAIVMDPRFHRDIEQMKKRVTIRSGHCAYRPGKTVLVCPIEGWCVLCKVVSVQHTFLKFVASEDYKDDGFASYVDMHNGMQEFYPDISHESPVTIIRWVLTEPS